MQAVAHPQVVATMPQLQGGTHPPRTCRSHPLYVHRLRRGSCHKLTAIGRAWCGGYRCTMMMCFCPRVGRHGLWGLV